MKIFEQIDWGQAEVDQNKIDQGKQTIVKTKTITPTPTPTPKPTPTPTPKQDIIGDQYVLKKDHVINYVPGSADTFLKNMFKWLAGSYRQFGVNVKKIYQDSFKYKWFTRKTITIPKGTKVYIHYSYVVMIVNDLKSAFPSWSTPDGNTWRIVYNYKDKTLSTSSYYSIWNDFWKKFISYPRFQEIADELGIDDIKYVTPKYRNDELIGFLRTLDPAVQAQRKYIQNLTDTEKTELDKKFKALVDIVTAYYIVLEKNPRRYFGTFKEDEDYNGAGKYFDGAVQEQFAAKLKWIASSKNSDIKDNIRKLNDMHAGVQNYLYGLGQGNSVQPPVFKFTLKHPYDTKKNADVLIRFNYFA